MIKVRFAKNESRLRDKKNRRLLLSIGVMTFHISQQEAHKLVKDVVKRIGTVTGAG
jgi:hypothetical protein